MEFHDIYWMFWLALIFLPYELYAAFSKKKGDTLSENVWDWFAIKKTDAKYGSLRRLTLMAFLVSLSSHFVYTTSVFWVILFGVGVAGSIVYHYAREKD